MSTNAKWIIGLLVAVVIGLAAGLIIVAGDNADDEADTVTVPSVIETRPEPTLTETETDTEPTETNGGGGEDDAGPGNGGLGNP